MKNNFIFLILILFTCSSNAFSTHLRGGFIQIVQEDYGSSKFQILITIYTTTGSEVPFGGGFLDFGDGTEPLIISESNTTKLNTGPGVATYVISHHYSTHGKYLVSYAESNRNAGIQNITASHNEKFHVETEFIIDPSLGMIVNTSKPHLSLFNSFGHNDTNYLGLTMIKPDDEVIFTYHLAHPKSGRGQRVEEYIWANHISINPVSGLFKWDLTKEEENFDFSNIGSEPAEFSFAVIVRQYKKINGEYFALGYTLMDFQVIVTSYSNPINVSEEPASITVANGNSIDFNLIFTSSYTINLHTSTDLPVGSYLISKDSSFSSETKSMSLNVRLENNNQQFNGPYFFIARGKAENRLKDKVITVFFHEEYIYPDEIITSSKKLIDLRISVYPIPTERLVKFNFHTSDKLNLQIYSSEGKKIIDQKISSGESIEFNQSGIYIYLLMSEKTLIKSGKIVVGN